MNQITPRRPLTSPTALADAGLIAPDRVAALDDVARRYGVAVTPAIAALIDPCDANDPVARQFLPDEAELTRDPAEQDDPIGDTAHSPVAGIVHRYPDRVLLKPVAACPVYCRYCFRRETVGPGEGALTPAELDVALRYIETHPDIWEVILSGGDPLTLSDRRLGALIDRLDAIPHVEVIRIHTRFPIADPARISDGLVAALRRDTPVYVVLHCNHARELSPAARAACARLVDGGIPMLAQTVLLKGVNDDAGALEALMRALVRNRIKPYYLHHPDAAPGTARFRTSIAEGQALMRALRGRLSGLCQPDYVLDIPGGYGKVPIGPTWLDGPDQTGAYEINDWRGKTHRYRGD